MSSVVFKALAGIYGRQLDKEEWPISLKIALTTKCNLRCYMCGTHSKDTADSIAKYEDMPEELFLKIEPLIRRVDYITLSGGEPTISGSFLQRVRRIRQLNQNTYLKINTNGISLSSLEFAEEMIPLFNCIYLSLNGIRTYEEITGGQSFKNIKQGLENIKQVRKHLEKPCQLVIGFVLMKKNLGDIVEAAMLAKEIQADVISYTDLRVCNSALKSESARHHRELVSLILEEIQKATRVGVPVRCALSHSLAEAETRSHSLKAEYQPSIPVKLAFSHRKDSWGEQLVDRDRKVFNDKLRVFRRKFGINFKELLLPCYRPWEQVSVFQDGAVRLCVNSSSIIGNLKEASFEKIWLGDEVGRYREGIITRRYYKSCAHCKNIFKDDPRSYETYRRGKKFLYRIKKNFFSYFSRFFP